MAEENKCSCGLDKTVAGVGKMGATVLECLHCDRSCPRTKCESCSRLDNQTE